MALSLFALIDLANLVFRKTPKLVSKRLFLHDGNETC